MKLYHCVTLSLLFVFGIINHLMASERFAAAGNPPITLTSEILSIVDGFSLGISGYKIGLMINLRHDILAIRFGKKHANGSLVGLYTFRGKPHTLQELRVLEEASNPALATDLAHILETIKNDFQKKIQPLMQDARGSKHHMVAFINEWANKTNRPTTYLLDWASTPEGKEPEAFKKNIISLRQLDTFMDDLTYFQIDIVLLKIVLKQGL